MVPFVSQQLNNLDLALALAKRGNLPGAEGLIVQQFERLFGAGQHKEAAECAAESPQVSTGFPPSDAVGTVVAGCCSSWSKQCCDVVEPSSRGLRLSAAVIQLMQLTYEYGQEAYTSMSCSAETTLSGTCSGAGYSAYQGGG